MFNLLLSSSKGKLPNRLKIEYSEVQIDKAVKTFFGFLVLDEVKIPSWMETPDPPWPKWGKEPWLVCYYAGPDKIKSNKITIDVPKKDINRIKLHQNFSNRLASFAEHLEMEEKNALIAIVVYALTPIQRIGLIDSSSIFNEDELKTISDLEKKLKTS